MSAQIRFSFLQISIFIVLLGGTASTSSPAFFTSCNESAARTCQYNGNVTAQLLDLKRGGTNILSTANYNSAHFPCQDFNYNCGYLEGSNDPIYISDGLPLTLSTSSLATILPSDPTLVNLITPYLNLTGSKATCVLSTFPLTLTEAQSNEFQSGFLDLYALPAIISAYSSGRKVYTAGWSSLNINIKTAVVQTLKGNMGNYKNTVFWNSFLQNDFASMSSNLKSQYTQAENSESSQTPSQLTDLHSAYLIDSVTSTCNKYQSINFLVDQSGSIGSSSFTQSLSFLSTYVNSTLDPINLMTINFFDSSFESYIGYNTNKTTMMSMITSKSYRGLGTNTGIAINQTIAKVVAQGIVAGVPKIVVIMTDGGSQDSVVEAANYGRSLGITFFCIGIGANINNAQLLQIAQTQSNIITITSFSSLAQLVTLISNYFCKQIINIPLNGVIPGNLVRVPTSPSYFRVEKSTNLSYQIQIDYASDPEQAGQSSTESMYDPFPDTYSDFSNPLVYKTSITQKMIFVGPIASYEVPVKQTLTQTSSVVASYLAVAGTNLAFNISMKPCSTWNCSAQIATCAAIGSQSYSMTGGGGADGIGIWIGIGAGLGLLGLAVFGARMGLDKVIGPAESQSLPDGDVLNQAGKDPEQQQDPSQQQQEFSEQHHSHNSHKSHKSHKSPKSHKQDKKSQKSQGKKCSKK